MLHIVMFKFWDQTPQETRTEMRTRMARLNVDCGGEEAGILAWRADWNLDRRKGYELLLAAVFSSQEAFAAYHAHPAHSAFSADMSGLADWVVGDLPWTAEVLA